MDKRIKAALATLVGKTISAALLSDDGTVELQFEDGTLAHVMSDPEGNGPGSLHVYAANAKCTPIGGR